MNQITCPNCGNNFQITESEYDLIVKQIKTQEIEKEKQRIKAQMESDLKIARLQFETEKTKELQEKNLRIQELLSALEKKEMELEKNYIEMLSQKDMEVKDLQSKILLKESEFKIKEKNLQESFQEKLQIKEEQISYYKDFKARQSTKMVGESLEQQCSNSFNSLRPLFPYAYFEKDNDIKTGSKGDFIFRDYDEDGSEFVSIMFEMKNEADVTTTKHKNEDFLKELDKDRKEKNCEYAVLVSLLEIDSELYNTGIVDMSHRYSKMYVIRPQFFIPLITLIRNLGINSLKYKKDLELLKNQNIDISHFEENMESFKEGFGRNYRIASEKFKKAIDEIDKTIDHLQKTKDALLSSENNLRLANNKAEELTIKKLTHNSETMAKMFLEEREKISS